MIDLYRLMVKSRAVPKWPDKPQPPGHRTRARKDKGTKRGGKA